MADAFAKTNTVYTYRYNTPADPSANPGSTTVDHAAENWMMFDGTSTGCVIGYPHIPLSIYAALFSHRTNGTTVFQPMTPTDQAFAQELIAYWLSFVRSGNPNTHKLASSPEWDSYSPVKPTRMVLQEGTPSSSSSFVEGIPAVQVSRCAFVTSKADSEQA